VDHVVSNCELFVGWWTPRDLNGRDQGLISTI
jgi:hypothetical protein